MMKLTMIDDIRSAVKFLESSLETRTQEDFLIVELVTMRLKGIIEAHDRQSKGVGVFVGDELVAKANEGVEFIDSLINYPVQSVTISHVDAGCNIWLTSCIRFEKQENDFGELKSIRFNIRGVCDNAVEQLRIMIERGVK